MKKDVMKGLRGWSNAISTIQKTEIKPSVSFSKLKKHRTRLTGLLTDKIDDLNDALTQFPETDEYVILKKEEKDALRYAIKLLDIEIERSTV